MGIGRQVANEVRMAMGHRPDGGDEMGPGMQICEKRGHSSAISILWACLRRRAFKAALRCLSLKVNYFKGMPKPYRRHAYLPKGLSVLFYFFIVAIFNFVTPFSGLSFPMEGLWKSFCV